MLGRAARSALLPLLRGITDVAVTQELGAGGLVPRQPESDPNPREGMEKVEEQAASDRKLSSAPASCVRLGKWFNLSEL